MPKINELPAAASASSSAVVAADNAAGTLTEKVTLGQIAALGPADGSVTDAKIAPGGLSVSTITNAVSFGGLGPNHRPIESNTLITSDASLPIYRSLVVGNTAWDYRAQPDYMQADDTFLSGFLIRGIGSSPAGGWLKYPIIAPPGATSLTFTCRARLVSGSSSANTFSMNSTSAAQTGGTLVSPTLTTTPQTVTFTHSVTPGTVYWLHVSTSNANAPVIDSMTLTASGATGVLAASYKRLGIVPSIVHGNGWGNTNDSGNATGWGFNYCRRSSVKFVTNATTLLLEIVGSVLRSTDDSMHVFVNGRLYAVVTTSVPFGTYSTWVNQALPTGQKRVEIMFGGRMDGQRFSQMYLRSIYIAATDSLSVVEPQSGADSLALLGDSILAGYDSATTSVPIFGNTGIIRAGFPGQVADFSAAGLSLDTITSSASTQRSLARAIGTFAPRKVWIALGVNDYLNNLSNTGLAANFETKLGSLIDEINRYAGSAVVYVQSPITCNRTPVGGSSINGTNGQGSDMAAFRTACSNVASARPYCVSVDGTAIVTSTSFLSDNLHVTVTEQPRQAGNILSILGN